MVFTKALVAEDSLVGKVDLIVPRERVLPLGSFASRLSDLLLVVFFTIDGVCALRKKRSLLVFDRLKS